MTLPLTVDVNLTPSSTELESPESTVVGVVKFEDRVCGVTAAEAARFAPVPTRLVAVTLNV